MTTRAPAVVKSNTSVWYCGQCTLPTPDSLLMFLWVGPFVTRCLYLLSLWIIHVLTNQGSTQRRPLRGQNSQVFKIRKLYWKKMTTLRGGARFYSWRQKFNLNSDSPHTSFIRRRKQRRRTWHWKITTFEYDNCIQVLLINHLYKRIRNVVSICQKTLTYNCKE